jgi:uncharacterized protein (TIGR00369 family)
MEEWKILDTGYETRVRRYFATVAFVEHISATLAKVAPGHCEMHVPYRHPIVQHHDAFYGGAVSAIANLAAGHSAMTLCAADQEAVTVEYKISFLGAGVGETLIARGFVLKAGRVFTACRTDVYAAGRQGERLFAMATSTWTLVPKADG